MIDVYIEYYIYIIIKHWKFIIILRSRKIPLQSYILGIARDRSVAPSIWSVSPRDRQNIRSIFPHKSDLPIDYK